MLIACKGTSRPVCRLQWTKYDLGFPDLSSGQKPWWYWYLTPVMNFDEVWRPHMPNPLYSPPRWYPWDLLRSFKVCADAKEKVVCGKQREATAPILHSKIANLVLEFAMEDLPLGRTATLIPEFALKFLPLGRTLMMMYIDTHTHARTHTRTHAPTHARTHTRMRTHIRTHIYIYIYIYTRIG